MLRQETTNQDTTEYFNNVLEVFVKNNFSTHDPETKKIRDFINE
jgi:hypothetical protein